MKLLLGEKMELKLNLPPSHRNYQNPIKKLLSNYERDRLTHINCFL